MLTLHIGNETIYLPPDESVTYNKQVNDLADIKSNNASFTSSFKVPKTHESVRVFENLGYVGDTSFAPYKKFPISVKYNGSTLINDGWLQINETTSTHYSISVIDGVIDLYKALEGKKIGEHLNLDELNHTKNVETIINSFTNSNYKYIYNHYSEPQYFYDEFNNPFLNADFLVPSANVKYLWNKIFDNIGFSYSGLIFSDENFTNAWITYPKSNSLAEVEPIITYEKDSIEYVSNYYGWSGNINTGMYYNPSTNISYDAITAHQSGIINLSPVPNSFPKHVHNITANFDIKINFSAKINYIYGIVYPVAAIWKNGSYYNRVKSDGSEVIISYDIISGGEVTFKLKGMTDTEVRAYAQQNNINIPVGFIIRAMGTWEWDDLKLDFSTVNFEETSFTREFKDFTFTELIKEVCWRYGLTPIVSNDTRHVTFYNIDQLFNTSTENVIDWSDKYLERKKEEYTLGNYGQNNHFKHKYTLEDKSYNDGVITLPNENLDVDHIVLQSKIYSPEENVFSLIDPYNNFKTSPTIIWKKEVKEESDGELKIEYKSESGRYYWMTTNTMYLGAIRMKSPRLGEEEAIYSNVPYYNKSQTTFNELIPQHYSSIQKLFNDVRVHEFELILTVDEVHNMDFSKVYYFQQEAMYYRCNSIKWKSNSHICTGEFVRISPDL